MPLRAENDIEHQNVHSFSADVHMDTTSIAKETAKDPLLNKVKTYVATAWPDEIEDQYKIYKNRHLLLCLEGDCLYYGNRIIIPSSLQTKVLERLHNTHIGAVRMKLLAQRYVWWNNIDKDIENYSKTCEACQTHQSSPSKVPLIRWKPTTYFFERIHLDFFQFERNKFLIIVDTFSRWLDVKILSTTNCAKVTKTLRTIFAYFGLPTLIVADNRQWTAIQLNRL